MEASEKDVERLLSNILTAAKRMQDHPAKFAKELRDVSVLKAFEQAIDDLDGLTEAVLEEPEP